VIKDWQGWWYARSVTMERTKCNGRAGFKSLPPATKEISMTDFVWIEIKDGNGTARRLFDRHYSRYMYKDGRKPKLFVGPGEKIVLMTSDQSALFVWRKFISGDMQKGINCAIFRNEGLLLSSYLILEAEKLAYDRWGHERLYTYVNAGKIRSANPGYCFKKAGWSVCGVTKANKLVILEKLPPANY
jgi:hypothetical protein